MTASTTVASSGRPRLAMPASRGPSQSVVAMRRKAGHSGSPAASCSGLNIRRWGRPCGPDMTVQADRSVTERDFARRAGSVVEMGTGHHPFLSRPAAVRLLVVGP